MKKFIKKIQSPDTAVKIAKVAMILIAILAFVWVIDYRLWRASKVKCEAGWLTEKECIGVNNYTPYINR